MEEKEERGEKEGSWKKGFRLVQQRHFFLLFEIFVSIIVHGFMCIIQRLVHVTLLLLHFLNVRPSVA